MQACTFSRRASLHQLRDRQVSHASASSSARAVGYNNGHHLLAGGGRRSLQAIRSLSDLVEDGLVLGTIASSVIAIGATVIAGARAGQQKAAQLRTSRPSPDDNDEDFSYALMGVVGCIPLFSWTAWVLPAILRPDRLTLFSLYALLYAAPLLKEGFEVEKYTIVMLILGQIHIQVQRLADKEPETLANLLPGNLLKAGSSLELPGGDFQDISREDGSRFMRDRVIRGGRGEELPPREPSPEAQELREFDRELLEREARKRRDRGGGGEGGSWR